MRLINLAFGMILALALTGCSVIRIKKNIDVPQQPKMMPQCKVILVKMVLQLPNMPAGCITRSLSRAAVQLHN